MHVPFTSFKGGSKWCFLAEVAKAVVCCGKRSFLQMSQSAWVSPRLGSRRSRLRVELGSGVAFTRSGVVTAINLRRLLCRAMADKCNCPRQVTTTVSGTGAGAPVVWIRRV